jgi:hypothetical protein
LLRPIHLPFGPAQHVRCDPNRASVFSSANWTYHSGITGCDSEVGKGIGRTNVFRYLETVSLEQVEQFVQIVDKGKSFAAANEHRLDGFLRCLLSIETQILKKHVWADDIRVSQVAASPI